MVITLFYKSWYIIPAGMIDNLNGLNVNVMNVGHGEIQRIMHDSKMKKRG